MAKAKSTALATRKSASVTRRKSTAVARRTIQPRDATVIATYATAGLSALDANDVESVRGALHGIVTFAVGMDARTGKRDPSKRKRK